MKNRISKFEGFLSKRQVVSLVLMVLVNFILLYQFSICYDGLQEQLLSVFMLIFNAVFSFLAIFLTDD